MHLNLIFGVAICSMFVFIHISLWKFSQKRKKKKTFIYSLNFFQRDKDVKKVNSDLFAIVLHQIIRK